MRPLGPSWRLLGRTWRYLGPPLAVLEAVLDHLGRSWRPSWTILEAILGQRGHLGGHLEPSWRIFWELGDVLGVLWVVWGREIGELRSWAVLEDPSGWPAGRAEAPGGVLLGKEPKPKAKGSSTPGTPVMNQQGAADRRRLRRITAAPCRKLG